MGSNHYITFLIFFANGSKWIKFGKCRSKFIRISENTIKQVHNYTRIDSIDRIDCSDSSDSRDSCNSSDGMHITELHLHKGDRKCVPIYIYVYRYMSELIKNYLI